MEKVKEHARSGHSAAARAGPLQWAPSQQRGSSFSRLDWRPGPRAPSRQSLICDRVQNGV